MLASMGRLLRPRHETCPDLEFLASASRVARTGARPRDWEPGLAWLARVLDLEPHRVAARDGDGQTALHMAAAAVHEPMARLLLSHGAAADARDKRGNAPLHLLMSRYAGSGPAPPPPRHPETERVQGDFEVPGWCPPPPADRERLVRLLVDAGADPEARNGRGETPLKLALRDDLPALADLLRSLGAAEPVLDVACALEMAASRPNTREIMGQVPEADLRAWLARPLPDPRLLDLLAVARRLGDAGLLRALPAARLEQARTWLALRSGLLQDLVGLLYRDGQRDKAELFLSWILRERDADTLYIAAQRLADLGDRGLDAWFLRAVVARAAETDRPQLLEPWGTVAVPPVVAFWREHPDTDGADWGEMMAAAGVGWAELRGWIEDGPPLSRLACLTLLSYGGRGVPPGWERPSREEVRGLALAARVRHVVLHTLVP